MSDQQLPPPTPPRQPAQPTQAVPVPPAAPPPPPPSPFPAYAPYPPPGPSAPDQWGPVGPPPPGSPPAAPPRRAPVAAVVVAVVAAVAVLLAAVSVPLLALVGSDDDTEMMPLVEEGAGATGLAEVQSYDDLDATHLEVGEEHDYPQSPAVGGVHAPYWLECGVYDEVVPETAVVHDLEHGTVWITYRPDALDADAIGRLGDLLPDNGILSPYPDQTAPVVVTVWGRQLALRGADDPRLTEFVGQFGAGETAPEPFASCHGGVGLDEIAGLAPGGTAV